METSDMTLCNGCLCEIREGTLPLCEGCYSQLLSLPVNERFSRVAEISKAIMEQDFQDSLLFEFGRFVDVLDDARRGSNEESPDWWKDGPKDNED